MSVYETIGFFIVVLGTGLFVAADMILAAFGAVVLWRTLVRGAELIESDEKVGREWHKVIKGDVRSLEDAK